MIVDYRIAIADDPVGLESAVRLLLSDAYRPDGGIKQLMDSREGRVRLFQAMVKDGPLAGTGSSVRGGS